MQPPRAHDERPPWPADGYRGGNDARRLEARERGFIRELDAPLDLETLLLVRTSKPLSQLSSGDVTLALTTFVETMRREVGVELAYFARAEAAWRRPDDGAPIRARLARLRWEADAYIDRLETETILLVMRFEERERERHAKTMAVTEQVARAGRIAGSRLAGTPHEVDIWGKRIPPTPHNAAPCRS